MFVCTYLRYRGLPAHVFKRGGSETCCASGPLLKKQQHTFGVLSQFDDKVFQLPSHLVHRNEALSVSTGVGGGGRGYSSSIRGSYYCLEVDLDDLIASVDLPAQVRWRLQGKNQ